MSKILLQSVIESFSKKSSLPICFKERLTIFSYIEQNKDKIIMNNSDYKFIKKLEKDDIKLKNEFNNICFCEKHNFKKCVLKQFF